MENYEVEFREIKLARTLYGILKSGCLSNGEYDPSKLRIRNATIIASPEIFGRLERMLDKHTSLVKKIRKPKN